MATRVDYRPYSGSCPRCHAALGLASVRDAGVWYCSPGCAQGEPLARAPGVSEEKLTNRPLRYFGRRRPKELRSAAVGGPGRPEPASSS